MLIVYFLYFLAVQRIG